MVAIVAAAVAVSVLVAVVVVVVVAGKLTLEVAKVQTPCAKIIFSLIEIVGLPTT